MSVTCHTFLRELQVAARFGVCCQGRCLIAARGVAVGNSLREGLEAPRKVDIRQCTLLYAYIM